MHTVDCGGCAGQTDGDSQGTGHSAGGGRIIGPLLPGLPGSTEEEWEGSPQRRKRWKNLRQSKSGRREGQRIRDGQGRKGNNNEGLRELGAAELGLGAGGASILITFLLGF